MPDPAFDAIVSHLRADDPAFARRLEKVAGTRPTIRLGVLLWAVAPLCIILGGWTGVVVAVIAGAYGTHLMRTRTGPGAALPTTPTHRPGAPL
ncbi:DUF3040 domain-containing protein [Actinoplanes sp. NPDC049548]|uniref:DUF3040 domain-containing protein n=1 Tax=Actinoplanes sp. NPDC049548 TaxID=3155152 RepID=UPI00344A9F21